MRSIFVKASEPAIVHTKHFFAVLIILLPISAICQEEDAAKAAQNPLANVISLPFQNNSDFGIGMYNKTASVVNIQPILPVNLGKKGWLLINRFIIPLPKSSPDLSSEVAGNVTGLGDINYTAWFSPPIVGKLTFGFGFVSIWPTATEDLLGQGKFSLGPSVVLVYANPSWVGATVISKWSSVAGDEARPDVNTFYFQYIFTYFLKNKWYLSTAPINLANLEASKGEKWTVPLGGGFGKMIPGKIPLDIQTQAFYNVVKPESGSTWQLRVQVKLIFPTGKKD